MTFLGAMKARFPKMFPYVAALVALGGGGAAAYDYFYGDCCYPGADCCRPGAACCLAHHHRPSP
jgi:hypothetical protein